MKLHSEHALDITKKILISTEKKYSREKRWHFSVGSLLEIRKKLIQSCWSFAKISWRLLQRGGPKNRYQQFVEESYSTFTNKHLHIFKKATTVQTHIFLHKTIHTHFFRINFFPMLFRKNSKSCSNSSNKISLKH